MLPGACPQPPPFRECDESPIYYTSARTVFSDGSNSLACSHICSWLKSEEKEKRKTRRVSHTLTQMHMDWHYPPPPATTADLHNPPPLPCHTYIPLTFTPLLTLAQLPQMCLHSTYPVDTHTPVCTLVPTQPCTCPSPCPPTTAAGPALSVHLPGQR